jgi:LacI family transcriptional regulator
VVKGFTTPVPDAKATILDVARHAGVSVGTVSYVLNGTKNVSAARRQLVLAAARALNYVPNRLAQGLRRGQSRLVGICLPNMTSALFAGLTDALEGIAAGRGFEVVQVLSHQDPALEHSRLSALLAHRLAGLLLVPSARSGASLDLVTRAGVPTVILDRATTHRHFDEITIANQAAMQEVVARFIALGHRRLLFIARYPHLVTTRQRIEAFRQAAGAADQRITAEVMRRGDDEAGFAARLATVLRRPDRPTALIASNTLVGLWTIRTLQKLGLAWPRDVSLLAFEHPDWADIMQPALSVVEHPTAEMAALAWEMLERRMADAAAPARRIQLQARVIQRPSMGSCPTELAGNMSMQHANVEAT